MVRPAGMMSRSRRLRRAVLRILGALLLAAAVLAASFLLAPTRQAWLNAGLWLARGSLPGDLEGSWTWPRLGRIEGRNLVWTAAEAGKAERDTLARVRLLVFGFDPWALAGRELRIREIRVSARLLDLPRIQAALPDTAPAAADTAAGFPFLAPGSVRGLPSVAIDVLDLEVDRLVLPGGSRIEELEVVGSAGSPAGREAHLTLDRVAGRALAALPDSLSLPDLPLDFAGAGRWRREGWSAELETDFAAPSPAAFGVDHPLAPKRDLTGRLGLRCKGEGPLARVAARVDLDPAADLVRGSVGGDAEIDLRGDLSVLSAAVDTLDLVWRGTALRAGGTWDHNAARGWFAVEAQDLELPALLAPEAMAGVSGRAEVKGEFSGDIDEPRVAGEAKVSVGIDSIRRLPGTAEALAKLPGWPADGEGDRLDLDLQAFFAGSRDGLECDFRADLGRTPWLDEALAAGRFRADPRRRKVTGARIDTLALALLGAEFRAAGSTDTQAVDLAGSLRVVGPGLARLAGPGPLSAAEIDLAADFSLSGPLADPRFELESRGSLAAAELALPAFSISAEGTRRAARLEAEAGGGVRLGSVAADSASLAWSGEPSAGVLPPPGVFSAGVSARDFSALVAGTAIGDSAATVVIDTLGFTAAGQGFGTVGRPRLRVGPGPGELAIEGLELRGDPGFLEISRFRLGGGLDLAARADLLLTREWLETVLPSPVWAASGGVDMAADWDVEIASVQRAAAPSRIRGRAGLALVPRSGEPRTRLNADFRLAGGDTAAMLADLLVTVDRTRLIAGSLFLPGRIDTASGGWLPTGGAAGDLRVPEQEVPLDFVNRFLPPGVSLAGGLTFGAGVAVAGEGAGGERLPAGDIEAVVTARDLRVNLPHRSRVDLAGELSLAGELADPLLAGAVEISSGYFRLAEINRSLLPTSGESVLWLAAAEDTTSSSPARSWSAGDVGAGRTAGYLPQMDVTVNIPGNFRIEGYGLEVELAGAMRISRERDDHARPVPAVRGRIRVVEGTFRVMNRVFSCERGYFDFQGRVPTDPAVDLVLVAEIEGTVVRILVEGTALQPRVTLESEPEMIQADIMAFLLFGRPFNDLDIDQRGGLEREQTPLQQMRRNLQGLALVMGAAGIQGGVAGRIGVDQVRIDSGTAGGSALVLGKYINPRMMLRYHQSLDRGGSYFMTLEYVLSRLFRLISTYGQGEEASGLELRWLQRY